MSSVQLRLSIEVRAYSPQRCKFIGHKTFSDVSGLANTNDNLLAPIAKGVLKKLDNNTQPISGQTDWYVNAKIW